MRSARANKAKLLGLSQTLLRSDKSKLSARDKLYVQAVDELTTVGNSILQKNKTIFAEVLKAAGNGNTESEQTEINQFSNIIRSIDRAHTREPGYDMIMHLFQIYDDCLSIIERYKNEDNRVAKLLLEKGTETVDGAYNEYLQKALERLNQTVEVFLKTLPEAELQKEVKIAHWLEKSKNEIHPDKKISVLMEFFSTYDY